MASKKIMVDIMVVDKNATRTINKATTAIDGMAQATNRASAAANKNKTNAGLNNAIIAESARLASDASYGFTAIANNLGQLVSLFDASRRAAGGLGGAISALFTKQALFLIAIQLLITYGQALYNFFIGASDASNKYKKSLEDLTATSEGNRQELLGYIKVLKDAESSEKARINALKELDSAIGGVVDAEKNNKLSLKDLTAEVEEYIKQQRLRMELDAVISSNGELFAEREKVRKTQEKLDNAETVEQQKEIYMENASFFDKYLDISKEAEEASGGMGWAGRLFGSDEDIDFANLFRSQSKDVIDEYDAAIQKIIEIQKRLTPEDGKGGGKSAKRGFLAGQLDFDEEIIQSQKRVSASLRKNKDQQIQINAKAIKEIAKLRQSDFAERQQQRVSTIKNEKDKAKAQIDADKAIADSRQSLNEYLAQIDKETERKINERRLRDGDKATTLLEEQLNARLTSQLEFDAAMATNDLNRLKVQKELEEAKTKTVLDNLERQRTAAIVAGEETIGIDQKISNAKEALANSNISFAEKERKTKLEIANYVADAIIAIAGEQSAVGKAVAVAMATMNTYEATTAALGSTPYGPWNIAQAAATAAFGFLQVRKILATKLPAGGGTGGGTGGAAVQAPAFNVVGASETSQLGMAIASTEGNSDVKLYWSDIDDMNNANDRNANIVGF
jgi:hypothetical protein